MVIFETLKVCVSFFEGSQTVLTKWESKPSLKAFKEANLHILSVLSQNKALKNFCTNLAFIGALSHEQEMWLDAEYYPEVHNILKSDFFLAVVFSEGHFQAIVHNYHLAHAKPKHDYVKINYFTDFDEALHWLDNVQKGQDAALMPIAP